MSKLKNRRKPSGRGIAKRLLKFRNKVDEMGYQKVPEKEILEEMISKGMFRPGRATAENALQAQYRYKSPTGYTTKVHTGMIGDVYSERGSSWVILTDEKDKIVFVREFYRDIKTGPLERLSAYAHFAKNIADSRPAGMKLIGITETEYGWQSRNNKHIDIIDLNDYIYDMAPEEKEFVVRHEKVRNYYLKSTDGLVTRQRTFQKKWK